MRRYFLTKDEAIAWITSEMKERLKQSDIPDFSRCLKIVARISYHKYAHYHKKYEATIVRGWERVASNHRLPEE